MVSSVQLCFLTIFSVIIVCEGKYGYVTWSENKLVISTTDYFADIPELYIARATYRNSINMTGVCILNFKQGCFSMNSNRLRGTFRLIIDILNKQGYAALPMNITEWLNAPAHERTPYLMREVGYRCEEMGMKLTAT